MKAPLIEVPGNAKLKNQRHKGERGESNAPDTRPLFPCGFYSCTAYIIRKNNFGRLARGMSFEVLLNFSRRVFVKFRV